MDSLRVVYARRVDRIASRRVKSPSDITAAAAAAAAVKKREKAPPTSLVNDVSDVSMRVCVLKK